MALIERLIGGDDKLSVHGIAATLTLLQSGDFTKAQALAKWPELTGQDIQDLGDVIDNIEPAVVTWRERFDAWCILGELGKASAALIRSKLGLP